MSANDSRKLLGHWLPPAGAGRPVRCLATSFTFDVDFFEEDCLSRFLGLDSKKGEGDDLAAMVEEDERLSEATVSVLVDRSDRPSNRNLRWDLLPIAVPGGLLHAKVAVLAWENVVRFIVGSANLTRAGYRQQIEAAMVLDAVPEAEIPEQVFLDLIAALRGVVDRAPGHAVAPGPKQRAIQTLEYFAVRIRGMELQPHRTSLRLAVVVVEPGRPALPQLRAVWMGGPARRARVMSPFFDSHDGVSVAAEALATEMAQRGEREVTFVLPLDRYRSDVVRAPRAILSSLPKRFTSKFEAFPQPDPKEPRRLHAKAVLLESDTWSALMVGSSNFTAQGLGLLRNSGHLEINVAIGTGDGSIAEQLRAIVPEGPEIALAEVLWEPELDEEESQVPPLPRGFDECLVEPGEPAELRMTFLAEHLPLHWRVELPLSATALLTDSEWQAAGAPANVELTLAGPRLPFWLEVKWRDAEGWQSAGWPVNVTNPGRLPPPDELRDLPVAALLAALASTRPIHEAVVTAIREEQLRNASPPALDLDPLRRYEGTGALMHRARKLSAALAGLRRRLERPLLSREALEWRLHGPFGPLAIAEGLLRDAESGTFLEGEIGFALGELALTLARVEWHVIGDAVNRADVRRESAAVLHNLREMHVQVDADESLKAYVQRAFAEALQ